MVGGGGGRGGDYAMDHPESGVVGVGDAGGGGRGGRGDGRNGTGNPTAPDGAHGDGGAALLGGSEKNENMQEQEGEDSDIQQRRLVLSFS